MDRTFGKAFEVVQLCIADRVLHQMFGDGETDGKTRRPAPSALLVNDARALEALDEDLRRRLDKAGFFPVPEAERARANFFEWIDDADNDYVTAASSVQLEGAPVGAGKPIVLDGGGFGLVPGRMKIACCPSPAGVTWSATSTHELANALDAASLKDLGILIERRFPALVAARRVIAKATGRGPKHDPLRESKGALAGGVAAPSVEDAPAISFPPRHRPKLEGEIPYP